MKLFGGARNISGSSSVLLDSLRIVAAMTVFFGHAYDQWTYPLDGHAYTMIDNIGHASVVVFFVLSGYVIAHTTTSNNRGKLQYVQARLSRLYSVVAPALLITLIAQLIVFNTNSHLYAHYTRGLSWPRYVFSGLFINEIWFFSAAPPINGPLWSLSFEFWYYVIFGLWFYKGKGWVSYLLPIVACIIAGPKILLMMPIWMAGNLAYGIKRPNISKNLSWLLVFVCLALAITMVIVLPFLPNQVGTHPFYFAAQFVTDWIIGLFISVALWLLPNGTGKYEKNKYNKAWTNMFRKFADLTFPIYVLHDPILIVWQSIFVGRQHDYLNMLLACGTALILCIVIGNFLENRRYWWTSFFKKILLKVKAIV